MTVVNLVAVFGVALRNSGGDVIIRLVVNPETASHLILRSAGGEVIISSLSRGSERRHTVPDTA